MDSLEKLVKNLVDSGYLKTPEIINAFRKIDRADFVLDKFRRDAYINAPLPIGYGQTISQPLTVAFMLELLKPEKGDKILDVGSGSGWQSALLGEIVGGKGKVLGIEIVPDLKDFGEKNIAKYDFIENGTVKIILASGVMGFDEEAPFDKIIVSAMAENIPKDLRKQLKINGRLVIPYKGSIWLIVKKSDDRYEEYEYPGFAFVPLISK